MIKRLLILILLCGGASLALKAQTTNPPSPPPASGARGAMAVLSEAERAQVKAAHDRAIQQDPSLDQKMKAAQHAMEEARKSMHDAMIQADPTIEPILAKMMPPKWGGRHDGGPAGSKNPNPGACPSSTASPITPPTNAVGWQQSGHHEPPGMAKLSETERQQLKSLHEQVKNDPAVVAAKQAKQNATTAEARDAAEEALHQAMHDAMIKADPSVEPILSKLHPSPPGQQPSPSASASPMVQ